MAGYPPMKIQVMLKAFLSLHFRERSGEGQTNSAGNPHPPQRGSRPCSKSGLPPRSDGSGLRFVFSEKQLKYERAIRLAMIMRYALKASISEGRFPRRLKDRVSSE